MIRRLLELLHLIKPRQPRLQQTDVMRCVWLDVFKLFTICEDKKFYKPFQNDEYIFATDKMSIVKVHQDFVGKKYNSENSKPLCSSYCLKKASFSITRLV